MITGKYSALKGFTLFFMAIIAVLSLTASIITGITIFIAASTLCFLIFAGLVVFLYSYWTKNKLTKGTILKINLKK